MSQRLPKGADLLAEIRRQGYRPTGTVFVFVDADRPRPKIYSDLPVEVEICIRPTDAIDELDLHCLAGLNVAVSAPSLSDRLRSLLKVIQRARPAFISGGVSSENMVFAWSRQRGWEFFHV